MAESELVVNLPVRLPPRPGDERLTGKELETLAVFSRLKKKPGFEKLPGSSVLRRYEPNDVICYQGQPGATAFYIITSRDLLKLRTLQVEVVNEALEAKQQDRPVGKNALRYRNWTEMALEGEKERLEDELAVFEERSQMAIGGGGPPVRAFIKVARTERAKSRGLAGWFNSLFGAKLATPRRKTPKNIPNADLPIDIDGETKQAVMQEGEVFGEMSCLNRSPRSATVVAEEFCYVLEFSRNVLDQMRRDDAFCAELDKQYRDRVLEGHVRQLPPFDALSDRLFNKMKASIGLVELAAGEILFEQHEESDSFYIVRNGWLKVVVDSWTHLSEGEAPPTAHFWPLLCPAILATDTPEGLARIVQGSLPQAARSAATDYQAAAGADRLLAATKLREAINAWIKDGKLKDAFKAAKVTKTEDCRKFLGNDAATIGLQTYPDAIEDWTDSQSRQLHRLALELAFPGLIPRRLEQAEGQRVMRYLGRGEFLGEVGLVLNLPRTATVVALSQPDLGQSRAGGKGLVGGRTELIRVTREHFQELLDADPEFAAKVHKEMERRAPASALPAAMTRNRPVEQTAAASAEFDELGIAQGQKLMLVDLERCTRCSSCVEACIDTHEDGYNRLYFDGPRFGHFMVPMTCRQCRDPVCMIGCPVGAINKGDAGQIAITDWCIGCTQCADQCPYGAIQMNELVEPAEPDADLTPLFEIGATVKKVTQKAVVCDLCSTSSYGPSCVRACPHDATIRVDGRQFFAKLATTAMLPPTMAAKAAQGGPA